LKYIEKLGEVTYDFEKNVQHVDMKYLTEDGVKVQIKVKGVGKDNKATGEVTVGEAGGEVIKLPDMHGITDNATLEKRAVNRLKTLSYTGYRGELTGWGIPYCDIGFSARIIDNDYPERTANYYVKSVKVGFSSGGFTRQIGLGPKLT
jgi:hypothetical protein